MPTKSNTVGYSATPLARKLGIAEGLRVATINAPDDYAELIAPRPPGVFLEKKVSGATDIVHIFSTQRAELKNHLDSLRHSVKSSCAIWVSWPKKASKVSTDITDNTIRELALPLGLVDIKVCAVSEVWSGLKLVIRKELR